MSRGLPSVLVTTPKLDDARVVFGAANCGWLKMLKNSVRNSRFIRSPGPKVVLLNTEKSKFLTPSRRRPGSTRDSFPKLNEGRVEPLGQLGAPASGSGLAASSYDVRP